MEEEKEKCLEDAKEEEEEREEHEANCQNARMTIITTILPFPPSPPFSVRRKEVKNNFSPSKNMMRA